jgi:hypothetical protein
MGRRSANEGSIYKRKKDGLWVAQYLVGLPRLHGPFAFKPRRLLSV